MLNQGSRVEGTPPFRQKVGDNAGILCRTDGGKVINPTHGPRSTPRNFIFLLFCFYYSFLLEAGLVPPEGLGKLQTNNSPHRVPNS
jgi:hypothetical protein